MSLGLRVSQGMNWSLSISLGFLPCQVRQSTFPAFSQNLPAVQSCGSHPDKPWAGLFQGQVHCINHRV